MNNNNAESVHPARLVREDLLALLDRCELVPVTLLLAPAGSGKSTLLEQWRAFHAEQTVVLYRIYEADDEPIRFFRRLLKSIRRHVSDFDTSWFNPLGEAIMLSPAIMAEQLCEALGRFTQPIFLLLDDFHLIESPRIHAVFDVLVQRLPTNAHLVIASRAPVPFSVSKLKLDDKVLLLDQNDLRWNETQIAQFNHFLGGEALSPVFSEHLLKITEGWIAGIRLALLAQARAGTLSLTNFNGAQPDIVEYFGQVVFKNMSEQAREFFLFSSIFDKFNGALCDYVMRRTESALYMEKIATREMFMIPVEGEPGFYRYHLLLRNYLAGRLKIECQQAIPALHTQAMRYFLKQQEFELALHHAQQSEIAEHFTDVLETACKHWVNSGHFGEILKWVSPLPEVYILSRRVLIKALITALTLSRRFNQAWYYLEALVEVNRSHAEQPIVEPLEMQYLEIALNSFQKHKDFKLSETWEPLLQAQTPQHLRAPVMTLVAYHHFMEARLEQSIRYATQSKALLAPLGHGFMVSLTDLIIALCYRNGGQADLASKNVLAQYEATDKRSPAWANRATAMIVALYEQNQLEKAQQLCEDVLTVINSSSATEAITTVYITLSRLLHHRKMQVRASRLLEHLHSILQLGNYAHFLSQLAQESLRQAYRGGKPELLEAMAQRFHLPEKLASGVWETVRPYDESWERFGLAAVYWLLGKGACAQARRILNVLATSARASEMKGRALVIEANLLVVTANQQTRDVLADNVRSLYQQYRLENLSRYVFDEAPGFGELLKMLTAAGQQDLPERYRETYADFLGLDKGSDKSNNDKLTIGQAAPGRGVTEKPSQQKTAVEKMLPRHLMPHALTSREQEILEFLLTGMSNADISESTGIALSTIKWHLKNIYSKLNVSNRTEAIVRLSSRTSAAD